MSTMDFGALEALLGYTFQNKKLLKTALTHSSYANEQPVGRIGSNERLEFLGDSVLSVLVCNYLYRTYPELPEGELTLMKKTVVSQAPLSSYARKIGLGDFLLLGKGEERDGRDKPKILEDAFEALLGAFYLDSGDLARVGEFVLPLVRAELAAAEDTTRLFRDYKTLLQQRVQETPGEELHYETVGESGPDNKKVFTVRVLINSNEFGVGVGSSKKEAEQRAAEEAFHRYLS